MGMERFVRPVSLDLPGARGSGRGDQLANHTSGPAWDKAQDLDQWAQLEVIRQWSQLDSWRGGWGMMAPAMTNHTQRSKRSSCRPFFVGSGGNSSRFALLLEKGGGPGNFDTARRGATP